MRRAKVQREQTGSFGVWSIDRVRIIKPGEITCHVEIPKAVDGSKPLVLGGIYRLRVVAGGNVQLESDGNSGRPYAMKPETVEWLRADLAAMLAESQRRHAARTRKRS